MTEMTQSAYEDLFARHQSETARELWPWQRSVLAEYASSEGDVAVELPTGAGKTLIGLLAGERFRTMETGPVAYLAGNKQLAQQVERQAREFGFPVVRFEDRKETWDRAAVRSFNYGEAIGVMNYWNYFNVRPGVEPAGMVILDDVHLLEGQLRDIFTVSIPRSHALFKEILRRIAERYPYYARVEDSLNDVDTAQWPEMLAFPDSADLADEVRDLLDAGIPEGIDTWWAWQNIREQLEVCCWLVSPRAITLAPYIPPSQTLPYFRQPSRRLYLSATVGTVDDLQRRLGAPPLTMLGSEVEPQQGERLVVIRDGTDALEEEDLVAELRGILERQKKALWLCARGDTAARLQTALIFSELKGEVRVLEANNGADEPFAEDDEGHLVAAGRYDGMDFRDEACRLEIVPEVPIATSDLEEFVSTFLRDAPFAEARFGQRVAQALGRCNRSEDDRAVYLLTDPEFVGRFSKRRVLDALPDHVRDDIYAALLRSDDGFAAGLDEAVRFLDGVSEEQRQAPPRESRIELPSTAAKEVDGSLALWAGDYEGAADRFDEIARDLSDSKEYRGFWLAMRSLALKCAADYGDQAARRQAKKALQAAVAAGGRSAFFTRLRLSDIRSDDSQQALGAGGDDDLFAAWDRLIDKYGTAGPRFDRWSSQLLADLSGTDHDAVARGVAAIGSALLGLSASAPQATSGEEDAAWELPGPHRTLTFEVKLAPKAKRVANNDVEQAEGAARAAESKRGRPARGILLTPHEEVDATASNRLERVRLMKVEAFGEQVEHLIAALRQYRRCWSDDAEARSDARNDIAPMLPPVDWLWRASLEAEIWIEAEDLEKAWGSRVAT
jgi:DNA-binding TFAR19-related protein (PDSD5 family)